MIIVKKTTARCDSPMTVLKTDPSNSAQDIGVLEQELYHIKEVLV